MILRINLHNILFKNDIFKTSITNPETFGTSLFLILADLYGDLEFLEFDPATIAMDLYDTLGEVQIPQANFDKLYAIMNIYSNNLFYQSPEHMTHVANALSCLTQASAGGISMEVYDPANSLELNWALTETAIHDPPDSKNTWEKRFSEECKLLIGVTTAWEGIKPVDLLSIGKVPKDFNSDKSVVLDPAESQQMSDLIKQTTKTRLSRLFNEINNLPLINLDKSKWQEYLKEIEHLLA